MNKRILRLAIPNVISNITIPLLGMIDIAVAGRLGTDAAVGAIAIGTAIFGFIYWNCAFIRMGTSGLTAQAFGARDFRECANLLLRGTAVSLGIAILLLIFQRPVGNFSMGVMNGSDEVMGMVAEYFFARIWAAPATVSLYAIHGWFIGMQNSKTPMYISLIANIVNITFSLWFVYGLRMGVAGIAWGTVVTQYTSLGISAFVFFKYYKRFIPYINIKEGLRPRLMLKFFNVNKDIFMRNVCNVAVYTYFTVASSGFGDTLLATNTILIQLFTFFSYMADGMAYAAEALTGRFIGAGNLAALKDCIRKSFYWSLGIALVFVLLYRVFWREVMHIFTNSQSIIECAGEYIWWIIIVPLVGFAPFLMDGILVGATRTRVMRNSMFLSTILFFTMYFSLVPSMGNNALWLSFICFLISRGLLQLAMTNRLKGLLW